MSVERSALRVERSGGAGAVFISYAREDAEAARRIAEALRAAGVEVWFDQSELRGGDAWDANIRQQIRECALFVPIISQHTEARPEGYFRLEWRLADRRTELMGKTKAFLLPVCIDATREAQADIPDSFLAVQWTRLAGGEASVAFCARVQRLLAGRSAVSLTAPGAEHRDDAERSQADRATVAAAPAPPRENQRRRWLVPTLLGAAATATLMIWQPWRKAEIPSTAPTKTTAPARLSEARQLAAKADALFDQDDVPLRETLALAEQFCKQAITLDPNDGEVWAVYSRLGSTYIFQTVDRSQERRAQAGDAATRAVQLAPGSFEARYARAYFFRLDDASYPEAERILRELLQERPGDKRLWRTLGHTLRSNTTYAGNYRGRDPEAIECYRRAASLPGGDPLSLIFLSATLAAMGRLDEADLAVDEAIALKPRGIGTVSKLNRSILYRGDVTRAREALNNVPVERLREDMGAFLAALTWWCAREPDKAIEVLRAVPRDYLEAVFDGPKGLLIGLAHRMAGRKQAAEIEWRAALQVIERRLAGQPNNVRLLVWQSCLSAYLGNAAEARRHFQAVEQMGFSARDSYWAAAVPLELGDHEKAIALLSIAVNDSAVTTRAFLRINPTWDPLRGDARFEALVAELVVQKSAVSLSRPGSAGAAAEGQKSDEASPKPDQNSIAVLAFENLSGDKENEYFSDGVSEELLNVLGRVPGLRVAARTSAFSFKGKNATAQEIGQKLGVAHLIEGSVRRDGSKVRIAARLSRADTGEQIWGESYEKELKNIFALQDEIARDVAQKLQLKLSGAQRAAVNPDAYRLVLEGRHFWSFRTQESVDRAAAAFTQAVAIEPGFAPAHAALASMVANWSGWRMLDGFTDLERDLARSQAAAQRAIALDATLSEPYATLGFIQSLDAKHAEAEENFQRALRLQPNDPAAHQWHGILQGNLGRLDLAIAETNAAVEIDPLAYSYLQTNARYLTLGQRWEEALTKVDRSLALRADFIPSQGLRARILFTLGRRNEAVSIAREIRLSPNPAARWNGDVDAIEVLRRAGLAEEASAYAAELLAKWSLNDYRRGMLFATLGRFDAALAALSTRTRLRFSGDIFWYNQLDPIREDPRFQELLGKLGNADEYKVARATLARMLAESRRTEGGGQRTEVRGQKSEVSGKAVSK